MADNPRYVECPSCASQVCVSTSRRGWPALMPSAKFYQCGDCGCRFVSVFGRRQINPGASGTSVHPLASPSGPVEGAPRVESAPSEPSAGTVCVPVEPVPAVLPEPAGEVPASAPAPGDEGGDGGPVEPAAQSGSDRAAAPCDGDATADVAGSTPVVSGAAAAPQSDPNAEAQAALAAAREELVAVRSQLGEAQAEIERERGECRSKQDLWQAREEFLSQHIERLLSELRDGARERDDLRQKCVEAETALAGAKELGIKAQRELLEQIAELRTALEEVRKRAESAEPAPERVEAPPDGPAEAAGRGAGDAPSAPAAVPAPGEPQPEAPAAGGAGDASARAVALIRKLKALNEAIDSRRVSRKPEAPAAEAPARRILDQLRERRRGG